ncbi:MAG: tetratricopeptide repeat protein [bacterium]|nr:tetratricopeptide repeat protein [bacterium]
MVKKTINLYLISTLSPPNLNILHNFCHNENCWQRFTLTFEPNNLITVIEVFPNMNEIKNLIILILIVGLGGYGCSSKKGMEEVKQTVSLPNIASQQEEKAIQKEQILKQVQDYIEKKEYEQAVLELNKAIELDPEDATLYYTLGDLYEQLGKDKESVEAFVKALQFDKKREIVSQEDAQEIRKQGNKEIGNEKEAGK